MAEYELPGKYSPEFKSLDEFTQGYVEALFFTEEESLGEDFAKYPHNVEPLGEGSRYKPGFSDLAPSALETIIKHCATFQATNAVSLTEAYESGEYDMAQAGRDFWFTRNGHGVGYWDREQLSEKLQEALSAASRECSGQDAYLGDDGKVYV